MTDHLEYRGCYETCFSGMKYNEFRDFVNRAIGKYKSIFYDKKSPSNNPNDKIKIIQAPNYKTSFFINCL